MKLSDHDIDAIVEAAEHFSKYVGFRGKGRSKHFLEMFKIWLTSNRECLGSGFREIEKCE